MLNSCVIDGLNTSNLRDRYVLNKESLPPYHFYHEDMGTTTTIPPRNLKGGNRSSVVIMGTSAFTTGQLNDLPQPLLSKFGSATYNFNPKDSLKLTSPNPFSTNKFSPNALTLNTSFINTSTNHTTVKNDGSNKSSHKKVNKRKPIKRDMIIHENLPVVSRPSSEMLFPKLHECAHFHYDEHSDIGAVKFILNNHVNTSTIPKKMSNNFGIMSTCKLGLSGIMSKSSLYSFSLSRAAAPQKIDVQIVCAGKSWCVQRTTQDLCNLDTTLHRCLFFREFSRLQNLETIVTKLANNHVNLSHPCSANNKYSHLDHAIITSYLSRLSILLSSQNGGVNCAHVLNWFEMDNKGNHILTVNDVKYKLLNSQAIGAAIALKRYVAKDSSELSFEAGDIISVISKGVPPDEDINLSLSSLIDDVNNEDVITSNRCNDKSMVKWKGKRGFEVGYFPSHLVELYPSPNVSLPGALPCNTSNHSIFLQGRINSPISGTTPSTSASTAASTPNISHLSCRRMLERVPPSIDLVASTLYSRPSFDIPPNKSVLFVKNGSTRTSRYEAVKSNHHRQDTNNTGGTLSCSTGAVNVRSLVSAFLQFFLSSRPEKPHLRAIGILKERVFGCDLGEYLVNHEYPVPPIIVHCCRWIEEYGVIDGIYRLSGLSSSIQKLRFMFDEDDSSFESGDDVFCKTAHRTEDNYSIAGLPYYGNPDVIHAYASVLKLYFRELPNPLLTYNLYNDFLNLVRPYSKKGLKLSYSSSTSSPSPPFNASIEENNITLSTPHHDPLPQTDLIRDFRNLLHRLPPPHYATASFLFHHLHKLSQLNSITSMHAKNLAIVWAPNILRSKDLPTNWNYFSDNFGIPKSMSTKYPFTPNKVLYNTYQPRTPYHGSIRVDKDFNMHRLALQNKTGVGTTSNGSALSLGCLLNSSISTQEILENAACQALAIEFIIANCSAIFDHQHHRDPTGVEGLSLENLSDYSLDDAASSSTFKGIESLDNTTTTTMSDNKKEDEVLNYDLFNLVDVGAGIKGLPQFHAILDKVDDRRINEFKNRKIKQQRQGCSKSTILDPISSPSLAELKAASITDNWLSIKPRNYVIMEHLKDHDKRPFTPSFERETYLHHRIDTSYKLPDSDCNPAVDDNISYNCPTLSSTPTTDVISSSNFTQLESSPSVHSNNKNLKLKLKTTHEPNQIAKELVSIACQTDKRKPYMSQSCLALNNLLTTIDAVDDNKLGSTMTVDRLEVQSDRDCSNNRLTWRPKEPLITIKDTEKDVCFDKIDKPQFKLDDHSPPLAIPNVTTSISQQNKLQIGQCLDRNNHNANHVESNLPRRPDSLKHQTELGTTLASVAIREAFKNLQKFKLNRRPGTRLSENFSPTPFSPTNGIADFCSLGRHCRSSSYNEQELHPTTTISTTPMSISSFSSLRLFQDIQKKHPFKRRLSIIDGNNFIPTSDSNSFIIIDTPVSQSINLQHLPPKLNKAVFSVKKCNASPLDRPVISQDMNILDKISTSNSSSDLVPKSEYEGTISQDTPINNINSNNKNILNGCSILKKKSPSHLPVTDKGDSLNKKTRFKNTISVDDGESFPFKNYLVPDNQNIQLIPNIFPRCFEKPKPLSRKPRPQRLLGLTSPNTDAGTADKPSTLNNGEVDQDGGTITPTNENIFLNTTLPTMQNHGIGTLNNSSLECCRIIDKAENYRHPFNLLPGHCKTRFMYPPITPLTPNRYTTSQTCTTPTTKPASTPPFDYTASDSTAAATETAKYNYAKVRDLRAKFEKSASISVSTDRPPCGIISSKKKWIGPPEFHSPALRLKSSCHIPADNV